MCVCVWRKSVQCVSFSCMPNSVTYRCVPNTHQNKVDARLASWFAYMYKSAHTLSVYINFHRIDTSTHTYKATDEQWTEHTIPLLLRSLNHRIHSTCIELLNRIGFVSSWFLLLFLGERPAFSSWHPCILSMKWQTIWK